MRAWCLAGALLFLALAALAGRRASEGFEIRADELDAGGSRRQSDSFWLRDIVASPQPAGVVQSASYESRGGYFYLTGQLRPGDLDENGRLDARDLFLFSLSWYRLPGEEPEYRRSADLVQRIKNPGVNEEDLLELLRYFQPE